MSLLIHDETLSAPVPPTILGSASPQDVTAIVKQEISLECNVQGAPFPTIQWYKDRKWGPLNISVITIFILVTINKHLEWTGLHFCL